MDANKNLKIAVIGPTQSGKTCLALGLFSTNTSGFTIQPVEEDGREYLANLKVGIRPARDEHGNIRPGAWPEASNLGTYKALRFDFLKKGKKPIRVEIPEYSGEMLRPEKFTEFANGHLRNLDGIVLLVNPGADAFQSGDQRVFEDYVAQYEQVLTYLRDPNNGSDKAFVALTVTASDRIKSDLQGKLDSFGECVSRLSNTLRTSGFRWKRFNVTITGHLKDQAHPDLAQGRRNLASKPFLWLLDELNWRPKREELIRKLRNRFVVAAAAAALAGAAYGIHAWSIWKEIDNERAGIERAITDAHNVSDLIEIAKNLDSIWLRTGLFSERARNIASDIEPKVWNVFKREIGTRISEIDNKGKGKPSEIDKLFNNFSPKTANCKKSHQSEYEKWVHKKEKFDVDHLDKTVRKAIDEAKLKSDSKAITSLYSLYTEKMAQINPTQEAYKQRKSSIERRVDTCVAEIWETCLSDFGKIASTNATATATRELKTLLEQWGPVTTTGKTAKVTLSTCMTNSIPKWRREYEIKQFNDMADSALKDRTLEALAKLSPVRVATNEYLTAVIVGENWNSKIKPAYDSEYKSYITSCVTKYANKQSSLDNDVRRYAAAVGHPFDADTAISDINSKIQENQNASNREITRQCNQWVRENITQRPDMVCHILFRRYRKKQDEMKRHEDIFNKTVRAAFYQRCEEYFQSSVEFFRENIEDKAKCEERFDNFKNLCIALAEDSGDSSDVSWAIRFAKKCIDVGKIKDGFESAFRQEFEVTSITGRYSGNTPWSNFKGLRIGIETEHLRFTKANDSVKLVDGENKDTCIWQGPSKEITTSLFATPPEFQMKVVADIDWKIDKSLKDNVGAKIFTAKLRPFNWSGIFELRKTFVWSDGCKLTVVIDINMKRLSGKSIVELLAEAKNEQP